jgi:hypothetical protein
MELSINAKYASEEKVGEIVIKIAQAQKTSIPCLWPIGHKWTQRPKKTKQLDAEKGYPSRPFNENGPHPSPPS